MTIRAMTEPWADAASFGTNVPTATIVRLTALSISSIDISMLIALRRARNPNIPIANSRPDRTRYAFSERDPQWYEIVGVVGNVKHRGLDAANRAELYIPHRQPLFAGPSVRPMYVAVRAPSDANAAVAAVRRELKRLDAVCGARVMAQAAIVIDWESWWALELPSKPSTELRLIDQVESYYRALFDDNVTADFVRPTDDLSRYRLVLVPNLYLVSDDGARNLVGYVRAGGRLVMSFFSGIVDPSDHVRLGGYPAPFREMLGIEVLDFLPLPPSTTVPIRWSDGTTTPSSLWTELVNLASPGGDGGDASKIAEFASGVLDGRPAVTRHQYGNGNAHYLATRLDTTAMAELLRRVGREAGVTPVVNARAGVEAIRREAPGGSILFLMNHTEESVDVRAAPAGEDLVGGGGVRPGGAWRLKPRDVAVIREPRGSASDR